MESIFNATKQVGKEKKNTLFFIFFPTLYDVKHIHRDIPFYHESPGLSW